MWAYLKAFFGWAVGRGYLEANPAAGISKPSREVARDRTRAAMHWRDGRCCWKLNDEPKRIVNLGRRIPRSH